MSDFEVIGFDNRSGNGPEGVMFGFVYFSDDRRAAYATGHGVTNGTGGWSPVTVEHLDKAEAYLDEHAPGWNVLPEKD